MNPQPHPRDLDRYRSFLGLDCSGRAERFVTALRLIMDSAEEVDPFWSYLAAKLDGRLGPSQDPLYHIHCHLNDIRDLLDRLDEPNLSAELDILETECC